MQNKQNTIFIALGIFVLFYFLTNNNICGEEGYQTTRLPFDTEGLVSPMKLDLFYEKARDESYKYSLNKSLIESKGLDYIAPPSKICADNLPKPGRQHDRSQNDNYHLFLDNDKLYYKFKHSQNKITKLENENGFLKDTLRKYKHLKPSFEPLTEYVRPNNITGLGIETQFKQGFDQRF